ncbi:uncharacterized protein LODBEIA_P34010 [Lodderomyces beijingensis]|uniref:Ubiquitin carboxyl-terminal hydrolase n=1 Tax=Lodderomyces beijingensis TaxID=1775926 RepID=A0ABP0ZM08_9ASCO
MFISKKTILFIIVNFSVFAQLIKVSFFKPNKFIAALSTSFLVFISIYFISTTFTLPNTNKDSDDPLEKSSLIPFNIPQAIHKIMNSRFSRAGANRFGSKKSKEHRFATKNGGEVGGLSNDGNTCFMNSVIQSLASSRQLLKYIDSYLYSEIELETLKGTGEKISMKSNQPKPELTFTNALKDLLDSVNGKYGSRGKEFTTKQLLNRMPNGPKQNFFSGYSQEDAQEFYQLIMNLLEKEFKKMSLSRLPTPEPEESMEEQKKKQETKYVDARNLKEIISGCNRLGKLGTVYVPAAQVDPNLEDAEHKVVPLELITPVDGITAERVGCLTCGESGGIRYAVNSGLSLNLPTGQTYYSKFTLPQLLDEWIKPETIDDVNCNRCGLLQTQDLLASKLVELKENPVNDKIIEKIQVRLRDIELELSKKQVTDEAFEKLTTKNQIKKSKKTKQIFMDRPPPLLSIHINRSQFDPRTYMVVKNGSNVTFPAVLDLSKYIVEPNEINTDARLHFRKQDEALSQRLLREAQVAEEAEDEDEEGEEAQEEGKEGGATQDETAFKARLSSSGVSTATATTSATPVGSDPISSPAATTTTTDPRLLYNLKAVIVHYGTHNYGHYICYRRLRGTWWRISDENVYVVREEEVLGGQGTFMLFYEYDDGVKEVLQEVTDDEEEESKENEAENEGMDRLSGASNETTNSVASSPEGSEAGDNELHEEEDDAEEEDEEEEEGFEDTDAAVDSVATTEVQAEAEADADADHNMASSPALSSKPMSDIVVDDDELSDDHADETEFNVAEAQVHL